MHKYESPFLGKESKKGASLVNNLTGICDLISLFSFYCHYSHFLVTVLRIHLIINVLSKIPTALEWVICLIFLIFGTLLRTATELLYLPSAIRRGERVLVAEKGFLCANPRAFHWGLAHFCGFCASRIVKSGLIPWPNPAVLYLLTIRRYSDIKKADHNFGSAY